MILRVCSSKKNPSQLSLARVRYLRTALVQCMQPVLLRRGRGAARGKCAVCVRRANSFAQTRSAGALGLANPASTHGWRVSMPAFRGCGCCCWWWCCCSCCWCRCSLLRADSACAAARFFRRCFALSTSICCSLHSSLQNGVSPLHRQTN
jgi:hypothetical protein